MGGQLVTLAILIELLTACFGQSQTTEGPQVLNTLPTGWTPIEMQQGGLFGRRNTSPWHEINIDNDMAVEYLLYFTYDNGQVGAIIYDQQTGDSSAVSPTPVPAPNQPVGNYVAYEVEPSYWVSGDSPDTVGFIAPIGTIASSLVLTQVQRLSPRTGVAGPASITTTTTATGTAVPLTNEMIIGGGPEVLSILWWRNTYNGYGITQMYAPGGLIDQVYQDNSSDQPLESAVGLFPEVGYFARSDICRKIMFERADAPETSDLMGTPYQTAVTYTPSKRGLSFCKTAPTFPFYPEGVVLAFLLPPPGDPTTYRTSLILPGTSDPRLDAWLSLVNLYGPPEPGVTPVVQDLRARPSMVIPTAARTPGAPNLTTNACAEVALPDGTQVRRLLFDLTNVPPETTETESTPSRWYISNITDITQVVPNCGLLIP